MHDYDEEYYDDEREERNMVSSGPTILVNGSYQPLEIGSDFMNSVRSTALQAGFGKFKVFLNGTEVRPSTAPSHIDEGMRVEIRPYDEAGKVFLISMIRNHIQVI